MPSRVIVFGYGEPALAALDTFAALSIAPLAVVVPGNRPGDASAMVAADAARRGYPVMTQPPRAHLAPFLDGVQALRPDFLFVWSYSMLLPPALLSAAARGGINLHAGALPAYRGGHVLNWTLINDERETAATLHRIDDGIDTGPVFAERRVPIDDRDDVASVHRKLIVAGASLLREWWPKIEDGTAVATPQDESRARYYRMRSPEDGRIDWSQTTRQIQNLVRALAAPWPGAFTDVNGTRVVFRAVEPAGAGAAPGRVVQSDESGIVIGTGTGALRITRAEIGGQPATLAELQRAGLRQDAAL